LRSLTLTLTLTLRKLILREETVDILRSEWKGESLYVEWTRHGYYEGRGEALSLPGNPKENAKKIVMTMYSTFHFNGVKIKDQTIARDVNALNKQLGEMKEEDAEEIKEERIRAVTRALKVFEDETPNPNPNPNPNPD